MVLTTTRALQLYQLLRLGSVILTSILLAKSSLSLTEIGTYEAMLFVGSVAAFFWANGLLQGIPTVYARLTAPDRPVFFFHVFLLFSGIALAICLPLWFARGWIVPALTGLNEANYLGWFCLYLFFNLATLPVEYLYLLQEKPLALAGWGSVSFGLYVAALGLPVFGGYGLEGGLIGLAFLGACRFLWALRLIVSKNTWQWRPELLRGYVVFSIPLVINLLVGSLVFLFDSWLVGWYFEDEAVFAVYRYGSREFPIATALATALGTAMVARIATEPEKGLAELKAKTLRLFHWVFPMTIVLLFFSGWLFPVVFNPAFASAAPLFNIYLLLTASRVLLPNAIVLAKGQTRVILVVGLLELGVKAGLGFWMIREWGLVGVAWSAVLAFWVEKIGLIWYLEKYLNVQTKDWIDWRWYAGYVGLLVLAWVIAAGG